MKLLDVSARRQLPAGRCSTESGGFRLSAARLSPLNTSTERRSDRITPLMALPSCRAQRPDRGSLAILRLSPLYELARMAAVLRIVCASVPELQKVDSVLMGLGRACLTSPFPAAPKAGELDFCRRGARSFFFFSVLTFSETFVPPIGSEETPNDPPAENVDGFRRLLTPSRSHGGMKHCSVVEALDEGQDIAPGLGAASCSCDDERARSSKYGRSSPSENCRSDRPCGSLMR